MKRPRFAARLVLWEDATPSPIVPLPPAALASRRMFTNAAAGHSEAQRQPHLHMTPTPEHSDGACRPTRPGETR